MKTAIKLLRDKAVLTLVFLGWVGFMGLAKFKWLLAGPPLLRINPEGLSCIDDPSTWLSRAVRTDAETFQARQMTNRERKVAGANWVVLHQTERDVYYGRPFIHFGAGGFRSLSEFGVQTWYVVDKEELVRLIPNFNA